MRQEILATATRLFARGGYAGTSISAIKKADSATNTTLYHHFGSKANCAIACLQHSLLVLSETIDRVSGNLNYGGAPLTSLRNLGADFRSLARQGKVWYLDSHPQWFVSVGVARLEEYRSQRQALVQKTQHFFDRCLSQQHTHRYTSATGNLAAIALHWWLVADLAEDLLDSNSPHSDPVVDLINADMRET